MKNSSKALRGRDIRKGNEKLVLRLIQKEGLLSQSEAVEMTGLKAPTILRIFTNLEEAELIQVSEKTKETMERKGRKPVFYKLNAEALYVLGVEFWCQSATVVISNFLREPVYSNTIDLDRTLDGVSILAKISDLIKDSLKKARIKTGQLAGIGIGAPGKVDTASGTVIFYSRIKGMENINIADYMEQHFDVPILIHNNCSVIAMNEYSTPDNGGAKNILAVLIRGGVGGAYINRGSVLTSGNITTMEIGHMSVDPNGRQCTCGFKGCLETYLSEDAIMADITEKTGIKNIAELEERLIGIAEDSSADAAELKEVLDKKARVLTYAVKNLMHLLSPDLFIIISRSIELSRYLSVRVHEIVEEVAGSSEDHMIKTSSVEYNPLHAGMGACDIVFQNFFSGGI